MTNAWEKFNLTELLNQRSKEVAAEESQKAESDDVHVAGDNKTADIYELTPSKDNFYRTEDIEELKQSIRLMGVLQPLLVKRKYAGKREIIAGHRRYIAVMQLVEEGETDLRYVPIIEYKNKKYIKWKNNNTLDKLALIMANNFREKTDWEKMTEALETEVLVMELKKGMDIPGKTRDLLAEIIKTSPAQIGRYKAINNNLIPELMEEFKENRIGISVIYEVSGLPEEYQKQAAELFRENEVLTLPDIKQLKKQYEAAQQIPGQMDINQLWQQDATEGAGSEESAAGNGEDQRQEETAEEGTEQPAEGEEEFDPKPDTINSLCYTCIHYEECHEKKATVTDCNNYINSREANKTDEERYNEEQAAIDRETARKLKERQQEEKMQQLPSDEEPKQRDIRLAKEKYNDITTGKLTFLLLKKDGFKVGEEIELPEYAEGQPTGRKVDVELTYIWEDWTGLDDDYCIIGFNVTAFDA